MSSVFEIHYYEDGFKTELIPNGARPDFLPPPPGLRSSEAELKQGDFAVELLCADRGGVRVVWIACHTAAEDRRLGNRGNYCGVGIWLVDLVPIYVDRLLALLRDAAVRISEKNGPSELIVRGLADAAAEFGELGWCVDIEKLPSALWAPHFRRAARADTTYLTTSRSEKLDFRLVGSDILHQFSRKPRGKEVVTQRRLYLQSRNSKIAPEDVILIDAATVLEAEEQAIADFCEETAEAAAKENALKSARDALQGGYDRAVADVHAARDAQNEQAKHISTLQGDLNLARRRQADLEDVFTKASNLMAAAMGRASGQPSGRSVLDEIHQIVQAVQDKLERLEREATRSVRRKSAASDEPVRPRNDSFQIALPPIFAVGPDSGRLRRLAVNTAKGVGFVGLVAVLVVVFVGIAGAFGFGHGIALWP